MKTLLGLLLAFAASVALAGNGNNNDGCQGNCPGGGSTTSTSTATVNNTNRNTNTQGQLQGQAQGQLQGQAQSATGGNATNAGNSQSITFNEQRQAVAAFAPAMNATAPCRVGVGIGVGAAVGGISLGSSYKDEECDAREKGRMLIEAARIAQSLGAPPTYFSAMFMEGLALIRGEAKEAAKPATYTGEAGAY